MPKKRQKKPKIKPARKKGKPVVLVILDGWGLGPRNMHGNAIAAGRTPFIDGLYKKYPNTRLGACGKYAGLPNGQEGNSEAGHLNIGAGKIVKQDVSYISESIKDGTFFKNTAFKEAIKHINKYNKRLHLMGMLSNGDSGHASPGHVYALLKLARQQNIERVFIHLFTDGRDSSRFAAIKLLSKLEEHFTGHEKIASVMGRFYAMDRNKVWRRTALAYGAIACGRGVVAPDAKSAILWAYNRGESDEFIIPTLIRNNGGDLVASIQDNDAVFFFNLRSDRARQLTKSFVQPNFEKQNHGTFCRQCAPKNTRFVAMTDFGPDLPHILTAFPGREVKNGLVELISQKGLRQLHMAESEKFAHITYFLNGGYAEVVPGEERVRIASPDVPRYDMAPEMSSFKIANRAVDAIKSKKYDFMAINFAAPDMIGHTGNFQAAVKTVEVIDKCVHQIVKAALERDSTIIVTADHGNIDEMVNVETGEIITEHSKNPVPFILVDNGELKSKKLKPGALANIAPTVLKIMGIPRHQDMAEPLF
ncbi:2,3-bisphosphoglycerate-independent phosphoglycerate mutase [Patescibacteria group bacterium]|nr:2,3-bisphosphoglycerate-independent phosphoglycerate mutase [Patescibacteria group bacterium]MBU1921921.1 2,3-bisphosphoglycerate-independent phosphoglycerate mutase [Patescibacteria group bacterium]